MRAIERVTEALRAVLPEVTIEQLKVKYPADDDGLWFVNHPKADGEVNIESSTGEFPFLIENNDGAVTTRDLDETVSAIVRALGLAAPISQLEPGMFEAGSVRAWIEQESIHLVANKSISGDSAELGAADARRLANALLKMAGQLQH